jgi:hypothetical protein
MCKIGLSSFAAAAELPNRLSLEDVTKQFSPILMTSGD